MEETPVSMGKIIHLQIINQQGKQWHSSGQGADVGSTFTLLKVSNQKSYVYLLDLDFIMDIYVEVKGGPLSLCTPGHNVFFSMLIISRPECGHHHSGHCNGGWHCSNEFETQITWLMVWFKVLVRPWWPHVPAWSSSSYFSSPRRWIPSSKVRSIPSCSIPIFCMWRLRSVVLESALIQTCLRVPLKCVSQISRFLLCMEAAKWADLRSQNINLQDLISHSIFFPNTGQGLVLKVPFVFNTVPFNLRRKHRSVPTLLTDIAEKKGVRWTDWRLKHSQPLSQSFISTRKN